MFYKFGTFSAVKPVSSGKDQKRKKEKKKSVSLSSLHHDPAWMKENVFKAHRHKMPALTAEIFLTSLPHKLFTRSDRNARAGSCRARAKSPLETT